MITMDKKYRTRDGRDVRILCVDSPLVEYPVIGLAGDLVGKWAADGEFNKYEWGRGYDLIEIVPDVVMYTAIYNDGYAIQRLSMDSLRTVIDLYVKRHTAITKTTVRNNGINGPSDVTVEVMELSK